MVSHMELIVSIAVAIFACSGFWTFLTFMIQRRDKKESAESKIIKGIGHDRICWLGQSYIKRGYITKDEYENLHDYLYIPYREMGGNGTAEKIMKDVDKLPLHEMGD